MKLLFVLLLVAFVAVTYAEEESRVEGYARGSDYGYGGAYNRGHGRGYDGYGYDGYGYNDGYGYGGRGSRGGSYEYGYRRDRY